MNKLILILLVTFLCSCKKDFENNGIIGKWKLTETRDDNIMGGDHTWYTVTEENSHALSFSSSGQYIKNEGSGGQYQQCIGTYSLVSNSELNISTNCTSPYSMTQYISELTGSNLILEFQTGEGFYKEKYIAIP